MATRELKAQRDIARQTANVVVDLLFFLVALAVGTYLFLGYDLPTGGLALVLAIFFGTIFWIFAIVMALKFIMLLIQVLAVTEEEEE